MSISGIDLFQLQGVLDRVAATYPGAVVSFLISAAYTLDHYQALGIDHPSSLLTICSLQLQLGQDPLIFSVKVFGGFIFFSTGSNDGGPVMDLPDPSFRFHGGDEIPHIAGNIRDGRIRNHMDEGVPIDLSGEIASNTPEHSALPGCNGFFEPFRQGLYPFPPGRPQIPGWPDSGRWSSRLCLLRPPTPPC